MTFSFLPQRSNSVTPVLQPSTSELAVTDARDEFAFHYLPNDYPANWIFQGSLFGKHFYPCLGEMRASGEECECAQMLDAAPQVKFWVRNLAKQERASFWLQTVTDRFYPNFVALLTDGRVLAVEYKGDAYATNDD